MPSFEFLLRAMKSVDVFGAARARGGAPSGSSPSVEAQGKGAPTGGAHPLQPSPEAVSAATDDILAATGGLGTDVHQLLSTLRGSSAPTRLAVAAEVERRTGQPLAELLGEELSGLELEQAMLLLAGKRSEADAARLSQAISGLGTDEQAIFETLGESPARAALLDAYQRRSGHALTDDLASDLSGDELAKAKQLAQTGKLDPVVALHMAMDGIGTDENLLRETLRGTTPERAREIRAHYKQTYGVDLDDELASELSGKEGRQIALMLPREPGPMFGTPAFEAAVDQATGTHTRGGNDVEMLFDGVNSFAERNAMIDRASGSINLQTFIFNDDATGWELALKLADKAKQGVKVRVIYDELGSARAGSAIFEFMRDHGVEVRGHGNPIGEPWKLNSRRHEKHLIIDGQESIEGGMNIADEYALGGTGKPVASRGGEAAWRDADVHVTGPAVADAQRTFLASWSELGDPVSKEEEVTLTSAASAPRGDHDVRVVEHRPKQDQDANIEGLYLQSVRSSRTAITIENAYFLPSDELRLELMAAAKRGVDVRIMTNSRSSNDTKSVADASRFFYDELIAAGVKIYETQDTTLHAKTAAFDGIYSIVGSANLNGRSQVQDSEVVMAVSGADVARELEQRFDEGLAKTREVSDEELQQQGLGNEARQAFFGMFRDFF